MHQSSRLAKTPLRHAAPLLLLTATSSAFHLQHRATASFARHSHVRPLAAPLMSGDVKRAKAADSALLLETCHDACSSLSVMVGAIYNMVSADESKATLKQDKSVFTLADGLVQALLKRMLIPHVAGIVGEEDEDELNIVEPPFRAGELTAPPEIEALVVETRDQLDALSKRLVGGSYEHLTPFIDPIDGTKEFATRKGEQCTICIGFASASGDVLAGIVYRPLTSPATFALGCAADGVKRSSLNGGGGDDERPGATAAPPRTHTLPEAEAGAPAETTTRRMVCSNGSLSGFTRALADELGCGLVRAGGAGNKALLLLEGVGSCYIQDRGLSRWDSCAAQAVLEAHGGCFAKLSAFAAAAQEQGPPALASYRYVKGDTNADFEPGVPLLTPYNARGGAAPEPAADGTPPRATDAAQLKPYANTCGLIALPAGEMGSLAEYQRAVAAAAAKVAPAFD